jgi:digeranylgeranylglycerophospholipid reductase
VKYDLIVVGGGPGGLMAALTAAQDGMKVVLVERRKRISDITTACLQILYVKPISQLTSGKTYMEPVTVEMRANGALLHNLNLGFTLEYGGQLKPYLNWLQVSPGGNAINRFKPNDSPWGFFYQKDVLCDELHQKAEAAGVKFLLGTMGESAEDTPDGVRVRVRDAGGHETLEADNLIAADGVASHIADSLGFGAERKMLAASRGGAAYICDGFESPFITGSLLAYTIPSLTVTRNIVVGQMADSMNRIGGLSAKWEEIVAHPTFAPRLRNAHLVKKQAWSFDVRTPLRIPAAGNTVVVGDAAAPAETWIMGAVACGYQAVKAIQQQRRGEDGYAAYAQWWQGAFAFNQPDYFSKVSDHYVTNRVCTDQEIDILFGLFEDRIGIPSQLISANMDLVARANRPLHDKLVKAQEASMWQK